MPKNGSFNAEAIAQAAFRAGYFAASSTQYVQRSTREPKHGDKYNRTSVAGAYSNAIARLARKTCSNKCTKAWQNAHAMRKQNMRVIAE